jgi:3-methyladenine DNA glycosylase/8-oxoguanine DNA glycosylase
MQITVEIPDSLVQQLQPFQDRLAEVLERGLQELLNERSGNFVDEQEIVALLASQPTPEQILAVRPSSEFQTRVSELLSQSKAGTLLAKGEAELERYLTLEHLVRLAKAHAYERLRSQA